MINLNKELKIILKKHYDYALVRILTNNKCSCWRVGNTPDPKCPRCEGLGWLYREFIERCKIFMIDSQVVSHMQDFEYGKTYSNTYTVYFPINDNTRNIKESDFLYTVKVDNTGKILNPIVRLKKFEITDILEFKCCGGKPEFIKALTKPVPV